VQPDALFSQKGFGPQRVNVTSGESPHAAHTSACESPALQTRTLEAAPRFVGLAGRGRVAERLVDPRRDEEHARMRPRNAVERIVHRLSERISQLVI